MNTASINANTSAQAQRIIDYLTNSDIQRLREENQTLRTAQMLDPIQNRLNMGQVKEYFAFISYKREDEKWAKWLQHKLEHYKLPVNVRKENPSLPQNIRPVFKDTSELASGVLALSNSG